MTRTGRVVAGVVVAVLAVGGAYGGVFLYSQHEAQMEIAQAFSELPPGLSGHVDTSRYSPLTNTLVVDGFTLSRGDVIVISVRQARLREITGDGTDAHPTRIGAVHLDHFTESLGDPGTATSADGIDVEDLQLLRPLPPGAPPPAGASRFWQPGGYPRVTAFRRLDIAAMSQPGRTIDHALATDLAPGHLGTLVVDGVKAATGSLAHIAANDVALDDLDSVLDPASYPAGKPAWTGSRKLIGHAELSDLTTISNGSLHLGSLSMDGVTGQPFATPPGVLPPGAGLGGELVQGLSIAVVDAGKASLAYADGGRLGLDTLHGTSTVAGGATTHRETLRGLSLPLRELPDGTQKAAAIAVLGDTPVLDADLDSTTNPDAQTVDIGAMRLALRNLGSLQLGAKVSGLDAKLMQQAPVAALGAAMLGSAKLRYEDASLADKLISLAATMRGIDPAQIRSLLHDRAAQLGAVFANQPDAAAVLDRFIDHPTALTITAAPAAPVSVATLQGQDPAQRAATLGLRVSAD